MKARHLLCSFSIASLAIVAGVIRADDAPPATPPADVKNSAKISPEARSLLDTVSKAYSSLKALDLSGKLTLDLQVEGSDPQKQVSDFTSSFVAPNRFRHETKGDVLIGSTGQKLYVFQTEENAYVLADAPKGRTSSQDLPQDVSNLLGMQNPSQMLAMSKDPGKEILDDVIEAKTTGDNTLDLALKDKTCVTMTFDPQTHLLKQVKTDLTAVLKKRRPDLVRATLTTDYTSAKPNDPSKDDLFAWSPPPGATDAAAAAAAHPLDAVAAEALEGKTAPTFKLKTLDGKTVALADLKGHVVILDFWATWCGPCRQSLPHLDELYQAQKDKGIEVFAVNQQESDQDVRNFVSQTHLKVPVLLDSDGRVGAQYGVEGIPQTVVIDKDGKVKKVIVGFGPEVPDIIKKAAGL